MQTISAAELANQLGSRRSGNGWIEKCPVHDDSTASVTIRQGDKAPLIKCQAGCNTADVLNQWKWSHGIDLYPPKPEKPQIVSEEDYQWWDGTLLYQKVRFEPKDFRNRRPDGNGGWIWNLQGVKEVLLRLPRIKSAIETGATVYVVEGEKDVRNLEAQGRFVTCNTHGASKDEQTKPKWTDYHGKYLEGVKQVLVIPDNDAPGSAHARAVCESLLKLNVPCKIVPLPGLKPKEDVSDFLARGGTADEIDRLAVSIALYSGEQSAPGASDSAEIEIPAFKPRSMSELMAKSFEAPRWAIDDLLPEGLTILAGPPKLGKSWMALDIANAISLGEKVLGDYDTTHGEVLYLALEDSDRRLQQRINTITDDDRNQSNANFFYETEIAGMVTGGVLALEKWLDEHPKCRLVIIDTLARFMPPTERGANAYQADYATVSRLQKLAIKYRIALICVTHVRKLKGGDVFDEVSGSAGITGPADAVWVLKRPRTETIGTLTVTGRDIDEMALTASFNKETCRWTLEGDDRQAGRRKTLVALVGRFGDAVFTYASAKDALGVSIAHSKRLVSGLVGAGYVTRLQEKVGKAFQFKLTEKMTDVVLGGQA